MVATKNFHPRPSSREFYLRTSNRSISTVLFYRNFSNLRSRNATLFLVSANSQCLPTLGDLAYQSAAPKLWNSLPAEITNIQTLTSFKRALKTYFFKTAFNSFLHLVFSFNWLINFDFIVCHAHMKIFVLYMSNTSFLFIIIIYYFKQHAVQNKIKFSQMQNFDVQYNVACKQSAIGCIDNVLSFVTPGRHVVVCFQRFVCAAFGSNVGKSCQRVEKHFSFILIFVEHFQRFYNETNNITNALKTIINALQCIVNAFKMHYNAVFITPSFPK